MTIQNAIAVAGVVALAVPAAASQPPATAGPTFSVMAKATAQRRDSPFVEGETFPDLAFPSLEDGTPTRLSDFRGTKVMLHVFASW